MKEILSFDVLLWTVCLVVRCCLFRKHVGSEKAVGDAGRAWLPSLQSHTCEGIVVDSFLSLHLPCRLGQEMELLRTTATTC